MKSTAAVIAILTLLSLAPATGAAVRYNITDLDSFFPGATNGQGNSINAKGQVVGQVTYYSTFATHAFFYDGTTIHDLGTLGGFDSYGRSINDNGEVAGESNLANGTSHAFYYDGTMHDLGTLSGALLSDSAAWGINNKRQITGISDASDLQEYPFLYDGTMHNLGTPGWGTAINAAGEATGHISVLSSVTGAPVTHAFIYDGSMHDLGEVPGLNNSFGSAINATGWVTGDLANSDGSVRHAFLFNGQMNDLGTLPGFDLSSGYGINDKGQIVGSGYNAGPIGDPNQSHAFIYDNEDAIVDLNSLISPTSKWILSSAFAINDSGQITGSGYHNNVFHAFLLTPVPEPSTIVLAGLSAVAILGYVRCRQIRRLRGTRCRRAVKD
jgi:probable HAF family extracellular repeat protein